MSDFRRNWVGAPLVADPVKTTKDGVPAIVPMSRPSSFTKVIEDTTALTRWSERKIPIGLAHALGDPFENEKVRQALAAIREANDLAAAEKIADDLIGTAKAFANATLAADRGTFVHRLTEAYDRREPVEALVDEGENLGFTADVQRRLVDAWRTLLNDHQLEIVDIELQVVNDEFRTAGTLDRIVTLWRDLRFVTGDGEMVTIPAGTSVVLDLKTGELKKPSMWNGYAAQIALYASSVRYDVDTDTRHPHPTPIDQRWGLLAHLDAKAAIAGGTDLARLLLVDLDAGRHACELAAQAKAWANRDGVFHAFLDVAPVAAPTVEHSAGGGPSTVPGALLTPAQQMGTVPRPEEGGDTRSAKDWIDLENRYRRLSTSGAELVTTLATESMRAGVSWHKREQISDRRFHLYDATISLAEQKLEVDWAIEAMRALIAYTVDADWPLFPAVTCGHALGALSATEAAALATAVRALDRGELVADLTRDVLELHAA